MYPMRFPQENRIMNAPPGLEEECQSLSVEIHRVNGREETLSVWGLTWRERLSVLLYGRVWLNVSQNPTPMVWLAAQKDVHSPPPREPGRLLRLLARPIAGAWVR